MRTYDLSIIIPLFNEEKNVTRVAATVVNHLRTLNIRYELILVDNGSSDATSVLIDRLLHRYPHLKKVRILKNEGYGWGVLNGLNHARGNYVGYIDGDGQFGYENIVEAYKKMRAENLDFCKGVRIKREDGFKRNIASTCYNILVNLLFLTTIRDINAKPKLMTKKCYQSLHLQSKDWFIDTEIMIQIEKKRYKQGWIPLEYKKRKAGKSNVRLSILPEFLKNLFSYRFRSHSWKNNPKSSSSAAD